MSRMRRKYGEVAKSAMPRPRVSRPRTRASCVAAWHGRPPGGPRARGTASTRRSWADLVAQVDARGVPAVLSADPDLEIRADFAPAPDAHPQQLAHALAIVRLEGIVRQDALLDVVEQELGLRVVAAVPHRRLGEVVRPERQELRVPSDLVGDEGGPRDLDHCAELVGDRNALSLHDALRLRFERLPLDA